MSTGRPVVPAGPVGDGMHWFQRVFGFPETEENVRKFVQVSASKTVSVFDIPPESRTRSVEDCFNAAAPELYLHSRGNGVSFPIGVFASPSVRELRDYLSRNPVEQVADAMAYEHVIITDVRGMHSQYPNALFQAASQFNCLEFPSFNCLPEHGITNYYCDHTQGNCLCHTNRCSSIGKLQETLTLYHMYL